MSQYSKRENGREIRGKGSGEICLWKKQGKNCLQAEGGFYLTITQKFFGGAKIV